MTYINLSLWTQTFSENSVTLRLSMFEKEFIMLNQESFIPFSPNSGYSVTEASMDEFIQAIVCQSDDQDDRSYLLNLVDKLLQQKTAKNIE